MVETFTPAVCGSRSRQRLAVLLFAVGALLASAALGASLGLVGGLLGTRPALIGAAVVAFLAVLREAGLLRVPIPQSRRQVPERWRSQWPLPAWSFGYGAGLGVGFLTFQPVATFWVACAAALALGRPLVAAAGFVLYGGGRAFMAVWPRRREPDGAAAVERLLGRTASVSRANVVVLVLAVVLLAVAPAAGAGVTRLGAGFDPSADGGTLALAHMSSGRSKIVVTPPAPDPAVVVSPAASPSLDGSRLAYADANGIKVIEWKTGDPLAEVTGNLSEPALDWPRLAFLRDDGAYERLILVDLRDPSSERRIASVRSADDLGRPSLRGERLAWHRILRSGSAIFMLNLASNTRQTIRKTKRWQESNPSLTRKRIVWVEQHPDGSYLLMRWFGSQKTRKLTQVRSRRAFLWTTTLTGRTAYVTRWNPDTRKTTILRVRF
jgi:hypothetical protein